MSILPEKFRPKQGSGGAPETRERFIDMNNGMSIMRNDREVFPRFKRSSQQYRVEGFSCAPMLLDTRLARAMGSRQKEVSS